MKDQRLSQKAAQIVPSTEIMYVNCETPNLPLVLVLIEISVRLICLPPFVFGFMHPSSSGPCWVTNGELLRMLTITVRQLLDRSAKDVREYGGILHTSLFYDSCLHSPGDGDVVSPSSSLSVRRRKRKVVIPSSLISVFHARGKTRSRAFYRAV